MPGWWARGGERARAFELVADFLRAQAGADTAASGGDACRLLQRLWGADGVTLLGWEAPLRRLRGLAASAPEWEFLGELSVDLLPGLGRILDAKDVGWVEEIGARWAPLPPPFLEAASLLIVPVAAGDRPHGCLLGSFGRGARPPAAEKIEAGRAVAGALGLRLEAERRREQAERLEKEREAHRRLEAGLVRPPPAGAVLPRLAAALRDLTGAAAVGLYECQPGALRQLAAAGALQWLPPELPADEPGAAAWQRALDASDEALLSPAQLAAEAAPWLARLGQSGLWLRVRPLPPGGVRLGVVLECAAAPPAAAEATPGVRLLSLLAAEALTNLRLRGWQASAEWRSRALFEASGEGLFFLSPEGVVLAANPALRHWTGYAAEELEQRPLADFLPAAEGEAVGRWLESRPEPVFHGALHWRTRAGFVLELEAELRGVPAEAAEPEAALLLGRLRDPVRERAAEERWQLSDARFRGLLDAVHDGVWVVGADGRIEFANHRLSQLFSLAPQQLGPGLTHAEAVETLKQHLHHPEQALARWAHLDAHPDQVCWDELEFVRPRRRVLERFARPLYDAEHRVVGRLEVYRDITSQRVLEDKVLQREKLASLGQLLSGVAHELNNPLTAVAGYAQLLLTSVLPAEVQEKARLLAREAERAGRVVQNLLQFARETKAEKQAVDLAELLERTLALRAYELKVANLRVECDFDPGGASVWGDPHQLQQVFLNLLLNAEQAIRSRREQGTIRLRLRRTDEGRQVQVEVADDGPGIPAAVLPHIFDPFFTTKPPQEGTGLGLSISLAIVKEHGGDIVAKSSPGEGAVFIVKLPARQPAAAPAPAPPERARAAGRESHRILVVDDEPAVAQLIADALAQQGYRVRAHTRSAQALAEALREPFHLAICDLRMPELDGPAFYRALRADRPELARRLLFTTGDTLGRETAAFLEEVGIPCLLKPFRVDELRSRVQQLLQQLDQSAPPRAGARRARAAPPSRSR